MSELNLDGLLGQFENENNFREHLKRDAEVAQNDHEKLAYIYVKTAKPIKDNLKALNVTVEHPFFSRLLINDSTFFGFYSPSYYDSDVNAKAMDIRTKIEKSGLDIIASASFLSSSESYDHVKEVADEIATKSEKQNTHYNEANSNL